MVQANSRMTLGAIFGALQTTAATITNVLNAVNDGVGMINSTVADAAERQEKRSDYDMANYEKVIHAEKALELDQSRDNIKKYTSQSAAHEEGYQSAYDELKAAVELRRSKRK